MNSHGLRGHQLKLFMPRCSTTARAEHSSVPELLEAGIVYHSM